MTVLSVQLPIAIYDLFVNNTGGATGVHGLTAELQAAVLGINVCIIGLHGMVDEFRHTYFVEMSIVVERLFDVFEIRATTREDESSEE